MQKGFDGEDADMLMAERFDRNFRSHNHYTITKIIVDYDLTKNGGLKNEGGKHD